MEILPKFLNVPLGMFLILLNLKSLKIKSQRINRCSIYTLKNLIMQNSATSKLTFTVMHFLFLTWIVIDVCFDSDKGDN